MGLDITITQSVESIPDEPFIIKDFDEDTIKLIDLIDDIDDAYQMFGVDYCHLPNYINIIIDFLEVHTMSKEFYEKCRKACLQLMPSEIQKQYYGKIKYPTFNSEEGIEIYYSRGNWELLDQLQDAIDKMSGTTSNNEWYNGSFSNIIPKHHHYSISLTKMIV